MVGGAGGLVGGGTLDPADTFGGGAACSSEGRGGPTSGRRGPRRNRESLGKATERHLEIAEHWRRCHLLIEGHESPVGAVGPERHRLAPAVGELTTLAVEGDGRADKSFAGARAGPSEAARR